MKINKKIIEELTGYLKEFNLTEIEYAEGSTKVKVSRSISSSSIAPSEVKKKQSIIESDGIIINAAGYTHTSVAILDALLAIKLPTIEVHITNIYNREEFRKKSLISKAAKGIICGFGVKGYIMALDSIKEITNK